MASLFGLNGVNAGIDNFSHNNGQLGIILVLRDVRLVEGVP